MDVQTLRRSDYELAGNPGGERRELLMLTIDSGDELTYSVEVNSGHGSIDSVLSTDDRELAEMAYEKLEQRLKTQGFVVHGARQARTPIEAERIQLLGNRTIH